MIVQTLKVGFRSVVLLRRTLGGMRTSVALVITAGTSQEGTPQIRIETQINEASKVFLEYKSVFHIWLKFNSRGLWRAKRGLFFFCFTWVFESPVWNLEFCRGSFDWIRSEQFHGKFHEKPVQLMTHHHSLYGSFLCPCWTSNFEPLVSIES